MAITSFSVMTRMGQSTASLDSDAAKAGAGLGILLGMGLLAAVWFVPTLGAAILGFLLKKNSIVETGPTGPLIGHDSTAGFANGWAGLAACAFIALIVVIWDRTAASSSTPTKVGESVSVAESGTAKPASTSHTWELDETSDAMDQTKEVSLTLQSEDKVRGFVGSHSAYLCIRCKKAKMEAYITLGVPVQHEYDSENYGVRTKFDNDAAMKSRWTGSTDREALFAPRPSELVKRLENANVFLFEFTPFEQRATAVKFNVAGLREKLDSVGQSCGLSKGR
jgi:hypothetical protein